MSLLKIMSWCCWSLPASPPILPLNNEVTRSPTIADKVNEIFREIAEEQETASQKSRFQTSLPNQVYGSFDQTVIVQDETDFKSSSSLVAFTPPPILEVPIFHKSVDSNTFIENEDPKDLESEEDIQDIYIWNFRESYRTHKSKDTILDHIERTICLQKSIFESLYPK